jgi:hypothetical protein
MKCKRTPFNKKPTTSHTRHTFQGGHSRWPQPVGVEVPPEISIFIVHTYISFVVIIPGTISLELWVHLYYAFRHAWGDSPYPGSVLRPLPCHPAAHNLIAFFLLHRLTLTFGTHPSPMKEAAPPDHLNHGRFLPRQGCSLSSGRSPLSAISVTWAVDLRPIPCLDLTALMCGSSRRGVGAVCMDFLLGSLGMRGTGASGLTVACSRWPGFLQQRYLLKYTVLHYTVACS